MKRFLIRMTFFGMLSIISAASANARIISDLRSVLPVGSGNQWAAYVGQLPNSQDCHVIVFAGEILRIPVSVGATFNENDNTGLLFSEGDSIYFEKDFANTEDEAKMQYRKTVDNSHEDMISAVTSWIDSNGQRVSTSITVTDNSAGLSVETTDQDFVSNQTRTMKCQSLKFVEGH